MAHITRIGSFRFRIISLAFILFVSALSAFAQIPSCGPTSITAPVHSDGLTEQLGQITLTCSGGPVGSQVAADLFLSLPTNITNRLAADGLTLQNINVSISGSTGTPTISPVQLSSPTSAQIQFIYTIPAGQVTITISGVLAAVANVTGGTGIEFVSGGIGGAGLLIAGSQNPAGQNVTLASPNPTLLESVVNNGIPCAGSPTPATLDFPTLISTGTLSSAVRITEGFATSFQSKSILDNGLADTGVRILLNVSGYAAGTAVYVPDAIVGIDGTLPTSAGEFGSTISSGTYAGAGSNQLLLVRVTGADATGNGGTPVLGLPGGSTTYTSVTQLQLTNGAGYAVYEVLDSSPVLTESAQIPVFVAAPATSCGTSAQTTLTAAVAPVSNVSVATQTDPIPRFIATTPASDCQLHQDCGANYFPQLQVNAAPVSLTGASLGPVQRGSIQVINAGSGQLSFSTSVAYTSGTSGWLTVVPSSGVANLAVTLVADPGALQPGTYTATVTIQNTGIVNPGTTGSVTVPVTFTVGQPGVTIQGIVNAANFQTGPVVPGSFVSIFGVNLSGKNVQVTVNGYPADVSYDSATQINVLMPSNLFGSSASVYASIDGQISNTFIVNLAQNVPAVFTPGILNQNNSVNLSTAPASDGDIVQVFLTGLAIPPSGQVTVNIGSATALLPVPGTPVAVASIPGLEQVNVQIPAGLSFTGNSAPLSICTPGTGGQAVCSAPVNLYLK